MNGKDRMLAAMTKGISVDFPVVIPYIGIFLRDHWDEITDQPWWLNSHNLDLPSRLKVDEDLYVKLGIDWVQTGMCPSKERREEHRVKTQGSRAFLVNTITGSKEEIERPPKGGTHSLIEITIVESISDVDEYMKVVDEEDIIRSGRLDYAKKVVERFGSEKFICAGVGTPFWSAYGYFGFKELMIGLFRRPKVVEYLLEKLLARKIEELRAYAKIGVDGVWVEECLASANEISLEQFKRFVVSHNRELISEIRRLGMKSIYYPCGDIRDRLELMIDLGPDCISLEESKKGFEIDLEWVDKVVDGRTCIFGNLDAVNLLPNGTAEELRREIKRQIEVGRRHGRFVMSLGSPVTPETTLSRVKEYVDITRRIAASL